MTMQHGALGVRRSDLTVQHGVWDFGFTHKLPAEESCIGLKQQQTISFSVFQLLRRNISQNRCRSLQSPLKEPFKEPYKEHLQ